MFLYYCHLLLLPRSPGAGRDQPEVRYQESILSGHALLSLTVLLLSLSPVVVILSAGVSVRERVRAMRERVCSMRERVF